MRKKPQCRACRSRNVGERGSENKSICRRAGGSLLRLAGRHPLKLCSHRAIASSQLPRSLAVLKIWWRSMAIRFAPLPSRWQMRMQPVPQCRSRVGALVSRARAAVAKCTAPTCRSCVSRSLGASSNTASIQMTEEELHDRCEPDETGNDHGAP
jgi:hypothetical protein